MVVCIQGTGNKIQFLNRAIDFGQQLTRLTDKKFKYTFKDKEKGHKSETGYRMVVIEK